MLCPSITELKTLLQVAAEKDIEQNMHTWDLIIPDNERKMQDSIGQINYPNTRTKTSDHIII